MFDIQQAGPPSLGPTHLDLWKFKFTAVSETLSLTADVYVEESVAEGDRPKVAKERFKRLMKQLCSEAEAF